MSTAGSFKEWEQMRIILEPLAYKYGVDIFTNGAPWCQDRQYRLSML